MKKHIREILFAFGVVGLVSSLSSLPALDRFHGLDIDVLHWLRANILNDRPPASDSHVAVVAIDERTHAVSPFKGIPKVMWTPQIADVQRAVLRGGAKVFGWDIILPTTASTYLANRRFDQPLLKALAEERGSGRVVLGRTRLSTQAIGPHRAFAMMAGGADNIRNLETSVDDDGISRSLPLFHKLNSDPGRAGYVSGMAMELATRTAGQSPRITPRGVKFLGRDVPVGPDGELVLNFDDRVGAVPTYSFADLYHCAKAGNVEYFNRAFSGKAVLFGLVLDIEDRKLTSNRLINRPDFAGAPAACTGSFNGAQEFPARDKIAGVYIHATAVNNLLRGNALVLPGARARFSAVILTAIFGVSTMLLLTPLRAAVALGLAAAAWTFAAAWVFQGSVVLPLVDPLAAAVLTSVVTLGYRFIVVDKDKRYLREAFSSYVSPNLVEVIADNPDGSTVAARHQECSFIFTDLADFTAMVESSDPEDLHPILNAYIDGMVAIAFKHEGTLDKVVGDALSIFFSAPVEQPDHAQIAVDCALELDAWAKDYAARITASGIAMGKTRIGVNTGTVVVGNFGGSTMFDYTAHGDAINTAARLESVNKHLGTSVCISGETVKKCHNFVGRPVGRLVLKGKSKGTEAFEPLTEEALKSPPVQSYLAAYELMAAGDPAAAEAFAQAVERYPDDPLIAFHHNRLAKGQSGDEVILADK